MGKINSREKGKVAEREIANILQAYGYDAHRGQQYSGLAGDADVVGVDGIHIEVKRREQFSDEPSLQQAERDARKGEIPVVFYRRSREKWKATMRMDMFMLIWNELTDLQKYQIREKIKFSVKSEKIGKSL
jgi:Holliday junction resolvase